MKTLIVVHYQNDLKTEYFDKLEDKIYKKIKYYQSNDYEIIFAKKYNLRSDYYYLKDDIKRSIFCTVNSIEDFVYDNTSGCKLYGKLSEFDSDSDFGIDNSKCFYSYINNVKGIEEFIDPDSKEIEIIGLDESVFNLGIYLSNIFIYKIDPEIICNINTNNQVFQELLKMNNIKIN